MPLAQKWIDRLYVHMEALTSHGPSYEERVRRLEDVAIAFMYAHLDEAKAPLVASPTPRCEHCFFWNRKDHYGVRADWHTYHCCMHPANRVIKAECASCDHFTPE